MNTLDEIADKAVKRYEDAFDLSLFLDMQDLTLKRLQTWCAERRVTACIRPDRTIVVLGDEHDEALHNRETLTETILGAQSDQAPPARACTAGGYERLADVLTRALNQAAHGKGAERHGQGRAFENQPMQQLLRLYGLGFALGQAGKKAQEAMRLPRDRAVAELLGAINYLAGAVIYIEDGGND